MIGKNHIWPDRVNLEAMDIPAINRRRDTDIVICEDLNIFLRSLKTDQQVQNLEVKKSALL